VSFQRKDPFQKLGIGWCSARMRYNPHGCLKGGKGRKRGRREREKGQEELIMRMRREKKVEEERRRRSEIEASTVPHQNQLTRN
jgi:hypothetical protein